MTSDERTPLMREVNNHIYETLASMGMEDGDFLCECGDFACSERVVMTLREYEGIKRRINRAAVLSRAHTVERPPVA